MLYPKTKHPKNNHHHTTMKILIIILLGFTALQTNAQEKLAFWDQPRKGANGDGGAIPGSGTSPEKWFKAARQTGIEFVRLNVVDWSARGKKDQQSNHKRSDFLMGDADQFTRIPKADLAYLKKVLDVAHKYQVKIVLTMFYLPGAVTREGKNNQKKRDYRLWTEERYQQKALSFWRQLAGALKDHPAIVGYNPLNEPHPGRQYGLYDKDKSAFEAWMKKIKDTSEDLNRFNQRIVKAIRTTDAQTQLS